MLIVVIFPSLLLNCPLKILTLSSVTTWSDLFLYFFLKSLESVDDRNFRFICSGAFAKYFFCFLGLLLDFQCFEKSFFILYNNTRYPRYAWPSFCNFFCNGPFKNRTLRVSFFIF